MLKPLTSAFWKKFFPGIQSLLGIFLVVGVGVGKIRQMGRQEESRDCLPLERCSLILQISFRCMIEIDLSLFVYFSLDFGTTQSRGPQPPGHGPPVTC